MTDTTRLGLQRPATSNPVADLRLGINDLANTLDDAAIDLQGPLSGLPTSTIGSPGLRGRFYTVKGDPDPTQNGRIFRDHGTGWDELTMLEAIAAKLGVTSGGVTRRGYAEVLGAETFAKGGAAYTDAGNGPSVTVTVPANGLVAVFAQADANVNTYVGLAEDAASPIKILDFLATETRYTMSGSASGGTSRLQAGWLLFPAAAGAHTYKLRGGNINVAPTWSNRKLWVVTFGF